METDSYVSTFIILVYVMTKCFMYNQLQKWLVITTKSICTIYIYIVIPKRYNINGDIIGQKYYMLKPMTFFWLPKIQTMKKKLKYLTHVHTLAIFHNNYSFIILWLRWRSLYGLFSKLCVYCLRVCYCYIYTQGSWILKENYFYSNINNVIFKFSGLAQTKSLQNYI